MRGLGITLGNVVSYNSLLDAMARAAGPHTQAYAHHALHLLVRAGRTARAGRGRRLGVSPRRLGVSPRYEGARERGHVAGGGGGWGTGERRVHEAAGTAPVSCAGVPLCVL